MLQSMQRALQRYLAEVRHATTPRGYSFSQELVLFDFTKEEVLNQWDCISDKDVGGRSHANLGINGKGLFTITKLLHFLVLFRLIICYRYWCVIQRRAGPITTHRPECKVQRLLCHQIKGEKRT